MPAPICVAVTGGTGFVGKALLDRAVESGLTINALTRRQQPARKGVNWFEGALDRPAALEALCDNCDTVIHIAGVVNAPDAAGFEAGNTIGTRNVVAAARNAGVRRFVHVSSLAAREPQLSLYGRSKARAELEVSASGLDWTILRPPAVYGPGDTEIFELFRMARRGFVLMPPNGRLSLIHVDDLARLLLALLPGGDAVTGHIFEPDDGTDRGWRYSDLGRAIGRALGRRAQPLNAPRWAVRLAAHGDRLVRRERAKLTLDRAAYMSHGDWTVNRERAVPSDIWTPQIATQPGLRRTANWYREQGWLKG